MLPSHSGLLRRYPFWTVSRSLLVSKFQTESCASARGSRLCFYFQTRWYPLGERLKVEQEKLHRKTEASGKAGTDLVFRFDSAFGFLGLFLFSGSRLSFRLV